MISMQKEICKEIWAQDKEDKSIFWLSQDSRKRQAICTNRIAKFTSTTLLWDYYQIQLNGDELQSPIGTKTKFNYKHPVTRKQSTVMANAAHV